jgi:Flp pilus assembly secretin CpaC
MLSEGQAIVIGGLIKETSNDGQNKIPFLGDLWLVGKLFQGRDVLKERNEIIITLLPRIASPDEFCEYSSQEDLDQATTPLLDRNLNPIDRTGWEGELPSSDKRKRPIRGFFKKPTEPMVTVPSTSSPAMVESGPVYQPAVDSFAVPTTSIPEISSSPFLVPGQ